MKQDTERKITIEDLIRLKKSERPPAEFWSRFESEIRSKQLSAIVNKRPWWHGISRAVMVFNRHQLPFGAAAALALTWMGVHYMGAPSIRVSTPGAAPAAVPHTPAVASSVPAPSAPAIAREERPQAPEEQGAKAASHAEAAVMAASASHLTKAPADIALDAAPKSPFSDGIAVTLADYRQATPDFARRSVFGTDSEFEPTAAAARQSPSEPLARMDPAEERRSRLLAPALPAYSSAATRALASDWMRARSSSDARMYESMDRGSNDRMLVGFRF